jgi:hypothetical protein
MKEFESKLEHPNDYSIWNITNIAKDAGFLIQNKLFEMLKNLKKQEKLQNKTKQISKHKSKNLNL